MNGSTFVNMFRMFWNNTMIGEYNFESGRENKSFDSVELFKIIYVFGVNKCKSEYCKRKDLIATIDAILGKVFNFYNRAKENRMPKRWLDIVFEEDGAEIKLHANDCACRITISQAEIQ